MALQSLYFENVTFVLNEGATEETEVSCSVTGATLDNDTAVERRNKLCGKGMAVGEAEWTLTVEYDQDWSDPAGGSLSQFLVDHAGEKVTAVLGWEDAASTVTVTVGIVAGPWGGKAGEVAEGSVELPVEGQPTFATWVPPAQADTSSTDAGSEVAA